jgi:hypothetical protein
MDYFLKSYKAKCKEEFGGYGFKCCGNTFWRVVNDAYQTYHLQAPPENPCNRCRNML